MERNKKKRKAVRAGAAALATIIIVLLLLTPAVQTFLVELVNSPFTPRYPESATFSLERSLTVEANGGEIISYDLDICEPASISQNGYLIQDVRSVSYSPQPSFREPRYGQRWAGWNGSAIAGNDSMTYKVTYEVTVYTHIWNIDRASSLGKGDIPSSLKERYLHDEWNISSGQSSTESFKIDMTSPSIASMSESIVGNETNVYQALKDIYDWMVANVEYSSDVSEGEPQSALETLQTRKGDCDDQSILFCSLARAAGIPAWLQMGALYVSADDRWGGHGWLQAYIPLSSGGGENVTIDVVNRDFLVFRPNRFVDFTDDGTGAHLADYYYTFQTTFDRNAYSDGKGPVFREDYTKVSYEESAKRISKGGVYDLDRVLMLLCTARPRPRT